MLSPGWSAYEWRLRHRTYDVVDLLEGESVLTVLVGNGWYRGRLAFMGGRAFYGDRLGVIAELEITYADGHRQRIDSDESWTVSASDVVADDLYDGQTIDARKRTPDWYIFGTTPERTMPDAPAGVRHRPAGALPRPAGQPSGGGRARRGVALADRAHPRGLRAEPGGLGAVHRPRTRGAEIRVRHAEVLEHEELGVRPLRSAQATDRFILSGDDDAFEPTMTFHGFRYAEVEGWPVETAGELTAESLEAVVVHSDLERTGFFECSEPLLNQLHQNVVWGTKGNFVDLPTDCPQRDERLGWTGDIAAFAPTAAYLFDVGPFLADWLVDLALEQEHADGMVAFVVPDVLKLQPHPAEFPDPDSTAIWSDAAVWVPWSLWQAYGDRSVLERQFGSMAAHLRRVETLLSPAGLWDGSFQFGDWLDPDAPPDVPWQAKADSGVVATACLFRSATIVAETARLLGRDSDADEFAALAARTRAAFNEHYVADNGIVRSDCTTVYTLAIVFDLLDHEDEQLAGKRLAELVTESDYRVSTGFAGTPYITDALTRTGHLDDAYRLLLERGCPSWLYPVTMGATTIWERWDSMLPDGTINSGEMTSFNHYALGAVADWMHRTIGGLVATEPGYRSVRIAPRPGGGLTWASTALETPHGRIEVSWRLEDSELVVDTVVPEGVEAVLDLDGRPDIPVTAGRSTHRGA